jgi:hypothetical protein
VCIDRFYFDRDVECVVAFFKKRFGFVSEKPRPSWEGVLATRQGTLDVISAASGFIGEREIAEFEKAGGLGERFGDEEGDVDAAELAEDEEEDDEDDDSGASDEEFEPEVMNEGTGQGGEKTIDRDEDIQFKSLRQNEAIALRRLAEDDGEGNMYASQLEPEPETEAGQEEEEGDGVSRLGVDSKVLEIKRPERGKSGHRRDAAEARLERLAQLSGEQIKDKNEEEDEEEEEEESEEDEAGLERKNTCPDDVAGKVHFIRPKPEQVMQKQGGEPVDDPHDEQEQGGSGERGDRPRFARGGGRRAPPKKLTTEEQAALIRKRVSRTKSGRARGGGGRGASGRGAGNKSKAKNAGNKNTKAMMQSI